MELLRTRYPDLEYIEEGNWVCIPEHPLPGGWNRTLTDVAFQIPTGYPGTPPYGIYTPVGLLFNGAPPDNYTDPSPNQTPFSGQWGIFSWAPKKGQWRATADLVTGANLLNWVRGFSDRFNEGK